MIDPSAFSDTLVVRGIDVDGNRILRTEALAAANAIAAIVPARRDATGVRPHCYIAWGGLAESPAVGRATLIYSNTGAAMLSGLADHTGCSRARLE
ncbi:hypothetical protein [Paractinoplanes hotanensis]|uniref:Uncharacterized protein n=1 Tax=Paractinoplanes hotanensis TaxID=2906497 RepID=A0ABT0YDM9_9ACTN|nr:hypothetical protein [Actinoplanes hotanensis]MCM4084156.1 hypothetical protein [Actinoplanes hotanensis]